MTERFPLAWPANRPRTQYRRPGKFARDGKAITVSGAVDRLDAEIGRMGASYPLLSSNLELRLDGRPRGGQGQPADPGVCVYFQLKGSPFALACDTYTKVEQNIAALAAHLEATRAIERHGVATAAESLAAFSALPPPGPRPWRAVLGDLTNAAAVSAAFRRLSAERHPDRPGGSHDAMAELTAARDAALKELGL
jgi:hypothetical protein